MFLLVLPIALAAMLLGARLIKNVTTPRQVPLDVVSVILSALGFGGLVYGLSSFGDPSSGEGAIPGWMSLSVGAVGLVAFILRQIWLQKRDRALLDLRTLTSKTFAISVTMMAISMMALFGTIILLPIYLQTVLRLDTLQTGFLLLPGGLVMGLLAPPVGRLYDRYGPTVLLVPGAIIVSAVLWLMIMLDQNMPIPFILAGHVAISIGLSLVFTPLFTASLSAVPPKLYSHGSALLGTVQQVAGATGVALFIALMSSRAAGLLAAGEPVIAATTGGIRTAFLCGAIISLFAVAAAFFIRKPAGGAMSGGMPGGH
jgi:DHA2 family lincomycin resistance protein-like MFS transporter